ncbi:MAG: tungstate ABC transporter ATP-binding protein [Candidatus Binatia bacterium]|nr:MAG: tungstate ABC transporter ATP-binding protein [Candidatus Binatia bacterium]
MLELRGVRYSRPGGWRLEVPEFRVEPGECVVVSGANGAGKSTLLAVLALSIRPERGELLFDGSDALRSREVARRLRRELVLVQQHPFLFDRSVFANVAYGLRLRGFRGKELETEVARALEIVGARALWSRHARELSGGEIQRVALARALVVRPRFLLLDEPWTSIDPRGRALVECLLAERPWRPDASVVVTTHSNAGLSLPTGRRYTVEGGIVSTSA